MKRTKKRPVGRPKIPDKKVIVSVRLSPAVARYLRKWDKPAAVIQSLIEQSEDYISHIGERKCNTK